MKNIFAYWLDDIRENSEAFKFIIVVAIITICMAYLYSVAVASFVWMKASSAPSAAPSGNKSGIAGQVKAMEAMRMRIKAAGAKGRAAEPE